MGGRWGPAFTRKGLLLQAAMPKNQRAPLTFQPGGRFYKGVVIATYVYDSDGGAYTDPPVAQDLPAKRNITAASAQAPAGSNEINGIYCDVLCYGRYKGIIPRALVTQGPGGIHEGEIYRPRAARIDVSGGELNSDHATNPADMDGDHVVVGFLDDDYGQPFIHAYVPHPNRDKGNDGRDVGRRVRLQESDGEPRFIKHRGVAIGIDDLGNITVDATRGHDGAYNSLGKEPRLATDPPRTEPGEDDPIIPEDGSSGNITFRTQAGAFLKFVGPDEQAIELKPDGTIQIVSPNTTTGGSLITIAPDGTITLEADTAATIESVTLGDSLKSVLEKLTVPTALGPSGTPINAATFSAFLSSKVKTT